MAQLGPYGLEGHPARHPDLAPMREARPARDRYRVEGW